MPLTGIISVVIAAVVIILIAVFVVSQLMNLNQKLVDTVDGHEIEIKVGDGFARISVDGHVADEIAFLWKISSIMQCSVGDKHIEVNLCENFSRYRITTLIDGVKNENLSN